MLSSEGSLRELKELWFLSFIWKGLFWLPSFCRGSQELQRTSFWKTTQTKPNLSVIITWAPIVLGQQNDVSCCVSFAKRTPVEAAALLLCGLHHQCYPAYLSNPVRKRQVPHAPSTSVNIHVQDGLAVSEVLVLHLVRCMGGPCPVSLWHQTSFLWGETQVSFWGSFSARTDLRVDETTPEYDSLVLRSFITLCKPHNAGNPYHHLRLFTQTRAALGHVPHILAIRTTYYCTSTQPSCCFRHSEMSITGRLLVMSEAA